MALPLTHEIPTWKAFGNRGEAWALQIAGTERGSGSGDLRGFSSRRLSRQSPSSSVFKSTVFVRRHSDSLLNEMSRQMPGRKALAKLLSLPEYGIGGITRGGTEWTTGGYSRQ